MLDEKELRRLTNVALGYSRADQTEVTLFATDSSLTRFANNYVHQNVAQADTEVLVRLVFGKKIGVASINSLEDAAVRAAVDRATELARHQVENPDFRSLPSPRSIQQADAVLAATASCTPERRARAVEVICRRAREQGFTAAGTFSTGLSQIAVANSLGVFAHHAGTLAECTAVVMSDTGSGYSDRRALDVSAVDSETVAAEAVEKAARSRNPITLEPGEYEVVLEDYAVTDLLSFLGYVGFSGLAVQEGQSFMAGHFGEQLLGDNITIWDDGLGRGTTPMPFDYEGVPKQRVTMIDRGVAKAVVWDSYTAGREGRESTGHALPAGMPWGPFPMNMFLEPGASTPEEMVRNVKRGVWVTRFWYTRVVHPLSVTVTGMTRDGTFLIENGEITRPVRNMRFTQSYLDALRNVDLIGRDTRLLADENGGGGYVVPAVKIARWNFTGATEF